MATREFDIMVDRLPEIKHHKKELKRIDWNIVKRLVILLYYDNKAKRTNIAMKCKLSYDNCLLYLNWLEMMDLIKKETNREGFELISLTDKGIDLYAKLQFVQNTFAE
jgi:predicted transcriptional regulator